jgi:GTP-dependent dephospho-CoA kinase
MLILPEEQRKFFKVPFGILYPDIADIIPLLQGKQVYTVGDVVTHRLIQQGINPTIAIIDGHTMRSPCDRTPVLYDHCIRVKNPPGSLSDELIEGLNEAVKHPQVMIYVDGEEDLAVIPLLIASNEGSVILYGQPGEGVVLCLVDPKAKEKARDMLTYFVKTPE